MRHFLLLGTLFLALNASAEAPASSLWTELKTKRETLAGFHQEFEVTQTYKTATSSQSSKRQIVLDMSQGQWREKSSSGSGEYIRIFDGKDLSSMEEGGEEYVRPKRRPKDEEPLPSAYTFGDPDFSKLMEMERHACGLPGKDHECVVLQGPLKPSMRTSGANRFTRVTEGILRVTFDTETGLLIASQMAELIDNGRTPYRSNVNRILRRVSYGAAPDISLFKIPAAIREVKELSKWNAAKIKKDLAGKPAPELEVRDLRGEPVSLSALKGHTVLLDFWTTWCPPCRADAPALEKLNQKYGGKELTIIGISVSEERELVEKFLKEHPHTYQVVLTTENEMPRPYEIGVFPTYIIIEKDGSVASAVEGDKGFAELRGLLKKAGLDTD